MNGPGYETCSLCHCQRRRSGLAAVTLGTGAVAYVCEDAEFCDYVRADKERRAREEGPAAEAANQFRSKLTAEKAAEMRQRLAAGEGVKPLARAFGVSPEMVRQIREGKAWKPAANEVTP